MMVVSSLHRLFVFRLHTDLHNIYKTFIFFCLSNSRWECSFHLRNYANRVVSEMNPQKEHRAGKWPPFITDSKLKLHASTKTHPPCPKPLCPKAPWPTGALSDLIWDSRTEKPLRPSLDLLLTMPVLFCNNCSPLQLSRDQYRCLDHLGKLLFCMTTRKSSSFSSQ